MFSVAVRYLDERALEPTDKIWDDECDYLAQAKNVLGTARLSLFIFLNQSFFGC